MIVELIKDPDSDDLILPLSDELMSELGWKVGDTLNFEQRDDGTIVVTKQ
jgi:hypothetical protein